MATDASIIRHRPHTKVQDQPQRSRHSWRRFVDRGSFQQLRAAVSIKEAFAFKGVDKALTRNDQLMTELRGRMPFEKAVQEASTKFKAEISQLCGDVINERDVALLQVIGDRDDVHNAMSAAQKLGLLHPPWMEFRNRDAMGALQTFVAGLDASRAKRHYSLLQRLVREVNESRKSKDPSYTLQVAPGPLALPEVAHVFSASNVARLRDGEVLVIDNARLITDAQMAQVESDLRKLIGKMSVASDSPCNQGSQSTFLPLFPGRGEKNQTIGLADESLRLRCKFFSRWPRSSRRRVASCLRVS